MTRISEYLGYNWLNPRDRRWPLKLIVYIDVYFMVNGSFDFCVLWLLARLQKRRQRLWRLLAGAAVGGLGAALMLYFSALPLVLRAILQYVLLPWLMLVLSFGFSGKKNFFHQLFAFYGMAFFLGGALLALGQEGKGFASALLATAVVGCFLGAAWPIVQKRQQELLREYEVAISFGGSWVKGCALLDTGNRLREPISGKPVMLAEFSAVKPGLSEHLIKTLSTFEDWSLKREGEEYPEDYRKIRFIPYRAVGTTHGLLPGIEAKQVKIWTEQESLTKEGVMLGLVFEPLAAQGEYQFILHEDIVC